MPELLEIVPRLTRVAKQERRAVACRRPSVKTMSSAAELRGRPVNWLLTVPRSLCPATQRNIFGRLREDHLQGHNAGRGYTC